MAWISTHAWLLVLATIGLIHALAYVWIVPLWQSPDEPMLYEYVGLVSELRRIPRIEDRSSAVEARLVRALDEDHFWKYTRGIEPQPAPRTLAEALRLMWMPRQVGGDPPLYFVLAAIPFRLVHSWSAEDQARLLRLLNTLLLPLVVVCAYGAANTLTADRPIFGLAVAGLVALHPMFAAIGASLGNDGLANFLGAALAWAMLHRLRHGPSIRCSTVIALLLLLALITKRTVLPYLVLLCLTVVFLSCIRLIRSRHFSRRIQPRTARRSIITCVALLAVIAWIAGQWNWSGTGYWLDARTERAWPHAWPGGSIYPVLYLDQGNEVIQPLPGAGTFLLRGRRLQYSAHIWGDSAMGRLIVYTGEHRQELHFKMQGSMTVRLTAEVPAQAPDIRFGLTVDQGSIYADDLEVRSARLPGNLLLNGSLILPALQRVSPLRAIANYLRLPDLAWALHSGRPIAVFSYGAWSSLLFASFWGYFGWLNVPFVLNSWWMPALELVCSGALLGIIGWLFRRRGTHTQRRQFRALLFLTGLSLLLLLLSGYAEPSGLQQGRYLFPMLVPIATILAWGYLAWLPRRADTVWLVVWLLFWSSFAVAALVRVATYYGHA